MKLVVQHWLASGWTWVLVACPDLGAGSQEVHVKARILHASLGRETLVLSGHTASQCPSLGYPSSPCERSAPKPHEKGETVSRSTTEVKEFFERVVIDVDTMRLTYQDEGVIEKMAEMSGVGEASEVADVGTVTFGRRQASAWVRQGPWLRGGSGAPAGSPAFPKPRG